MNLGQLKQIVDKALEEQPELADSIINYEDDYDNVHYIGGIKLEKDGCLKLRSVHATKCTLYRGGKVWLP